MIENCFRTEFTETKEKHGLHPTQDHHKSNTCLNLALLCCAP